MLHPRPILASALVCCATLAATLLVNVASAQSLPQVIRDAQQRVVKIYGAGGLRGLEPYQSGFLVSSEGHIVTAYSYVLDAATITVTLDDGRKFEAELLGADPRLEIAVLKVDETELPCFDLKSAPVAKEGARVLAFSNLYGVATGDEPVSVLHGTISAVSSLAARRGAFESPYQGTVYVVDAMTNNPGAVGGALTNHRGQLLGMLGKELRNSRNNTWLNYALPAAELVEAVEAIKSGNSRPTTTGSEPKRPERPLRLADLGLVLVPNVLERTPPFIDRVRPGGAAAKVDIQPDDLIVLVNGQLVQSHNAVLDELAQLEHDAEVRLTLLRGSELFEVVVGGER